MCNTIGLMAQARRSLGQPQQLVLTLFGAYARPRDRQVWSGGLVRVLGELGVSPGAARVTLTRLAARGMLTRSKAGRLVHYAITSRTAAILAEGDERIFTFGRAPEDGDVWTVLWHTIPEDRRLDRNQLVRRLRFLGFGPVQDGAWIAPRDHEHEVVGLVTEMGLREHASVLVGRPSAALDPHVLVTRAWDLDDLATRYDAFVADFAPLADPAARERLSDRDALRRRTQLVHTYRQFPAADPELPASLVDPPPQRAPAIELFRDVYAALGPPAQRYFDQVSTP
jgi:phenylacetic acid degradation operon negative regulatory protein